MNSRPFRTFAPLLAVLSALPAFAQTATATASNPDDRAREIGRAYQRFQEQLRNISASTDQSPWWRTPPGSYAVPGTREKLAQAQRQFHDAIRAPLGAEPIASTGRDTRYTFLPEAKQVLVAQIDVTYAERTADVRRDAPNVRLPADTEKLKQIAAARERELLAILTPQEFELLEMRSSQSSMTMRQRFGEAIESEEEFRKIFVLQKAFDDKYPIEDALYSSRQQELMRQRSEAERKMLDEVRLAVGDERFTVLRRAMDQDFQAIRAIARRLNLPETTIEAAMKIRDNYATQSMTINSETTLNPNDRRALLQDLAKEARKELTAVLTPGGVEAYAARAQWLRYLEGGTAFSTNPKDSSSSFYSSTQSTYPVYSSGVSISAGSSSGTTGTIIGAPAPSASRQTRPASGTTPTNASGKKSSSETPPAPSKP